MVTWLRGKSSINQLKGDGLSRTGNSTARANSIVKFRVSEYLRVLLQFLFFFFFFFFASSSSLRRELFPGVVNLKVILEKRFFDILWRWRQIIWNSLYLYFKDTVVIFSLIVGWITSESRTCRDSFLSFLWIKRVIERICICRFQSELFLFSFPFFFFSFKDYSHLEITQDAKQKRKKTESDAFPNTQTKNLLEFYRSMKFLPIFPVDKARRTAMVSSCFNAQLRRSLFADVWTFHRYVFYIDFQAKTSYKTPVRNIVRQQTSFLSIAGASRALRLNYR